MDGSINIDASIKEEQNLKRFVREFLLPDRFINHGRNEKLSKVIAFIGPRGSLKSLSGAAMTIVDYLVPGYNVWSNMNISWGLKLGDRVVAYQTIPLAKAELLNFKMEKGMVFIDEINAEYSEARRSMTNKSLAFNMIIQQIRKKKLNLIYTVQHEMWIDNRLRWQTDMFIKCRDILLQPGGNRLHYDWGEIGRWTAIDASGILGHGSYYDTQQPAASKLFYGKQWWNTYDTNEIQDEESSFGQPDITMSEQDPIEMAVISAITDIIQENKEAGIEKQSEDEVLARITDITDMDAYEPGLRRFIGKKMRQATKASPKWTSGIKYFYFDKVFDLLDKGRKKLLVS